MIVVRVELWSAVTHKKTELARMFISNDETVTLQNPNLGNYNGVTFIGRSAEALDKQTPSKRARVENWRRNDFHVWNLVRAMLENMGYTKGAK